MKADDHIGYVLHRRAFGESSVTLELLTENLGRVGAFAKAARTVSVKSGKDALAIGARYQLSLAGNGELLQLRRFEMLDTSPSLMGQASLALMYINELLIYLLPKNDSHPQLFAAYRALLPKLTTPELAFHLRCFERGLLDELGYGVDFVHTIDGDVIDADQHYRLDPEQGFAATDAEAIHAVPGAAILAFNDAALATHHIAAMRTLMRRLIATQLDGRTLKSWEVMRELTNSSKPRQT